MQYVIWALLLLMANVLDSVTTTLALNKLPDNLKAQESNPLMNSLFKKRRFLLANLLKYGVVLFIIAYGIYSQQISTIQVCAVLIWLAVFNNAYILLGRIITKRKIKAPVHKLCSVLHIPESWHVVAIIIVLLGLTWVISVYWLKILG
jgi:hypothetical protein